MWLDGARLKRDLNHGETDGFGFALVSGRVHVHDLGATILLQLGLDHIKRTYRATWRTP
jgi:hypothetical protein